MIDVINEGQTNANTRNMKILEIRNYSHTAELTSEKLDTKEDEPGDKSLVESHVNKTGFPENEIYTFNAVEQPVSGYNANIHSGAD